MLKRKVVLFSTLLILIVFQNCLQARGGDDKRLQLDAKNIQFGHLTVQDGLSGNNAAAVLQDSQGFMWFGTTNSGLNKFDGLEFTNYVNHPGNPDTIINNYTWRLYQDVNGAIWVVTWGGGVSKYDQLRDAFINFSHEEKNADSLSSNLVWSVLVDRDGTLWVGTDGGLDRYDPERKAFIHYRHDSQEPTSISHNKASMVLEGADGVLWVSTYGGGLNKFDPQKETFIRYSHNKNAPHSLGNDFIWSLLKDKDGILWIGTEGGLDKFDPESETFTHYRHDDNNPQSLSGGLVTAIFRDSKERLWIGTSGQGLNLFDSETETFLRFKNDQNNPHSLADNAVWDIYEDATGALWFATFNGVDRYDSESARFMHYEHYPGNPNSLSDNQVQALHNDLGGSVWIGTRGGGLNFFDTVSQTFSHFLHDPDNPESLSNNTVLAIAQVPDGDLWLGTGAGLARFDPQKDSFIRYKYDPDDPLTLSHGTVWDLDFSPDGSLWIGLYGGGLDRFNPASQVFTHFMPIPGNVNSLLSEWITTVFVDSAGMVWIGTEGGVSRLDPQTEIFTNYLADKHNPHSLSDSTIHTIYEDDQGTIWIGTNQGLNRFNQELETFTVFDTMDGLPGEMVASIINDSQGNLWLGTNQGLSEFDLKTNTFRNYDVRDGLQSNQFRRKAVSKSGDGQLFFGGTNGFNSCYPERMIDNQFIPPVRLTQFLLFNKPVKLGSESPLKQNINVAEQIILSHDQSVFSFKFASLNYRFPQKNQYAYIMEGFDKGWTNVDSRRRFATYTNLDPGNYTFRVKGSNNDGIWNDQGATIKVIILPPWWETAWFRILLVMTIAGLISAVFQWRLRAVNGHRRELENRNNLLRSIMDNTMQLQGVLTPEGRMIDANYSALEMINASKETILGHYFWQTPWWSHDPALSERVCRAVSEAAKGDSIHFEAQHIDAFGMLRYVDFTLKPLKDSSGKVIYLLSEGRDITEYKQLESYKEMGQEVLHVLNASFGVQDSIERVVAIMKSQTGFDAVGFRLWNGKDYSYVAQQGFSEDFLLAENSLIRCGADGDIYRDKDGKVVLECTCGLVLSGKTDPQNPLFTPGGSFWTNDSFALLETASFDDLRTHPRNVCLEHGYASVALVPIRNREGIIGLIQFNDRRKGCFSHGTIELLEGIASHIGEAFIRMETEKELQLQNHMQELLMNISTTYINLSLDKVESSINASLQEMAEFVGADRAFIYDYDFQKQIVSMTHEWCVEGIDSLLTRMQKISLSEGLFWDVEKHRRGEPIWIPDVSALPHGKLKDLLEKGKTVASLSFPLMGEDGCLGFAGFSWVKGLYELSVNELSLLTIFATMLVNIRQRKLTEEEKIQVTAQLQQSQKMESIGTLAGGIAHDFNNILSSVIGYTEIVLDDELPKNSPVRDSLENVLKAAFRAKDLVKQILTYSRQAEYEKSTFPIGPIVTEVVELLGASLPVNIAIRGNIIAENTQIFGNVSQIHQVIMNLGTNAGYAMRDTGGTLDITVSSKEFVPEDLNKPFDLIHGAYIEVTVTDTGTGMDSSSFEKIFEPFFSTKPKEEGTGLGLSVVHGIIKDHDGTIIVNSEINKGTVFKVYFPQLKFLEEIGNDEPNFSSFLPPGSERILVVDDEFAVADMIKTKLERLGYTVTMVTNSKEALDIFVHDPNGFDLVITDQTMPELTGDRLAHKILSIRPGLPVIICTGYSHRLSREQAKKMGFSGYLMKPITQMELTKTIRQALMMKTVREEEHGPNFDHR